VTVGAIRHWRDETGDTSAPGAARFVLGWLLLANAIREADELRRDYFGDVFHWPLLPEELVPSKAVYGVILLTQGLLAVLVVVGRGARPALAASALLETFVLACDRLSYHHNRYALSCYALLLAFAPCDRSFRLGKPASRAGPLWAARLAALQVSIVYVASAGSKLVDPDWRGGVVLLERFRLYGGQAVSAGVPERWVDALTQPGPTSILAKLAIATELCLAFGLWAKRTRAVALWTGVWFHLVIEGSSRVEGFTWLTLAMYALFATPDFRARTFSYDPRRKAGRALGWAVMRLDWLARFRVEAGTDGSLFEAADRDGVVVSGLRAVAVLARGLPLFFPFWLPLALVTRRATRGSGPPEAAARAHARGPGSPREG
jgi:Vitamin K-dependent gamma-carboxylase